MNHQVIALDPSSPLGYETKHVASLKIGDYGGAVDALEEMLSKLAQSPDPNIQRELYLCYHTKANLLVVPRLCNDDRFPLWCSLTVEAR